MMSVIIIVLLLCLIAFFFWATSHTFPQERYAEIVTYDVTHPPIDPQKEIYTVMTYNLGYLSGMTNNTAVRPSNELFAKNMQTFLEALKTYQPAIIGFQEIDFDSHRSYHVNHPEVIAQSSGLAYAALAVNWDNRYVPFPYWPPSVHFGKTLAGQAVLSRFPIVQAERIVLAKPTANPFYYNAFYLDRLIQVVKLKIKEKPIIVISVHLEAFQEDTRRQQVLNVMEVFRKYKKNFPVLLIGDFNSVPPDAVQKKDFSDEPEIDFTQDSTIATVLKEPGLKAAYQIENTDPKSLFTFPSDNPTRKLDYVFYTADTIQVHRIKTVDIDCSDHLPLVVEFSLIR